MEAVRNVSFHVDRGETLAIVGESGSGKSVTSLALMRLVEYGGGRIVNGGMLLRRRSGEVLDLVAASDATLRVRGADVAMIFQEPMTSLNPSFTAGNQIAEALRLHQGLDAAAARADAAHAGTRAHPRGPCHPGPLSAPAVRRHAPARHDRHGAVLQAAAADRRRAHHRAGRDHPGPDPATDPAAAGKWTWA